MNQRIPKTHDIEELGELVKVINPALAKVVFKYKKLTELAVIYRYPDAQKKKLTFLRAKSASNQAHIVYDRCYLAAYGKLPRIKKLP